MKTFHHAIGHISGRTMRVGELITKLKEYDPKMPVFGTWESVRGFITPNSFSIDTVHKGDPKEAEFSLLIDVEEY